MKLLFGTAGIPNSTLIPSTINGIKRVKTLGLDAMELEFVRSINVSNEKAPEVKKTALDNDIKLTCHGQYFVNLNAQDKAKLEASKKRMIDASERAFDSGVWSICYHMAFYMGQSSKKVTPKVIKIGKEIKKELDDRSVKLWLRPESAGKVSQWGDIDEMIDFSESLETLPCIDWAHHHARSNGKFNSYSDYKSILEKLENSLGKEALDNMHCHIEGIKYSEKGERSHLNLKESTIDWQTIVKVWKEFNIKGVIISESPNIEKDSLMVKKRFNNV